MNASWPEKVDVIEPTRGGHTELLSGALSRHNPNISVKRLVSCDVDKVLGHEPDLVFWVLAGQGFSILESSLRDREPTPDTRAWWDLVSAAVFPVHLIVPSERFAHPDFQFTALDTVAMILSGVSGIWEGHIKLAADLDDRRMVDHLRFSWSFKRVFLYGKPAVQLYDFHLKITGAWPTTIETDGGDTYLMDLDVKYCFETALTLASVKTEEMKLDDSSGSGMEKYAQRLLEFQDRTGLVYALSVVTRALRYLDRGWADRILNHNKKRRDEMPVWARQDGFPARLPLIRDCAPYETSKKLYDGLLMLDFEREWEPGKLDYTTVAVKST